MKRSQDHTQLKRLAAISFVLMLCLSALPMLAPSAAAAEGETIPLYVWDGEGSTELASEAANWYQDIGGVIVNDVLPTNNSHVRYDATSVKSCTWDLDASLVTVNSLTLATGYTGTLTQGDVDMGIGAGGFTQYDGVFTGNKAYNVYCGGNWANNGGFFTNYQTSAIFTGMGTTIDLNGRYFAKLHISSDVTIVSDAGVHGVGAEIITVDEGCTLTLQGDLTLANYENNDAFYNYGVIKDDDGYKQHFIIVLRSYDKTVQLGDFRTSLTVELFGSATRSCVVMLDNDTELRDVLLYSKHPSNTVSLDLNGHSLTASGITIGTRGAMLGGEGVIRTAAWDSTAGTWTPEESTVVLADGGTVKLAPGQSFNRLEIASDDGRTASWSMTATGAQAPIVTGLESGVSYRWYLDGVKQGEVEADENGTITLSYMSTGLHTIEVKPNSMTLAMDGMSAAIGIIVALAVLGGLFSMIGGVFGRLKF